MTRLGLPIGPLFRLLREAPEPLDPPGPIVVAGPLASQLARSLAANGDASLVRDRPGPEPAVLVCVLAGDPSPEQSDLLRDAVRRGTPVVGVQTGATRDVPYIPAVDIVDCPPGSGFPIERIAAAIAATGGRDAAALAARLPVLRRAVVRTRIVRGAVQAAAVAGLPWVRGSHLPQLLVLQTRLSREVAAAGGHPAPAGPMVGGMQVRPELGLALAAGLAGRGIVRALPHGGAPVRAAVAAVATLGIGALAAKRALSLRTDG